MPNNTNHQGIVNQNHNDMLSQACRMAVIKKKTNNKCWRGCGKKKKSSCAVSRKVNWYSHYGEKYGDSSEI